MHNCKGYKMKKCDVNVKLKCSLEDRKDRIINLFRAPVSKIVMLLLWLSLLGLQVEWHT